MHPDPLEVPCAVAECSGVGAPALTRVDNRINAFSTCPLMAQEGTR